ncbi:hypothetical protein HaLaN_02890 [Haematococcus lacustris]|uniref:Uncharacterized protein n=1 Tax=Haematococcus lacustris TaxID=44745 RepID=A0A699YM68_HAELA|nr:hypothetical protein HaLaN_02890 [Haematococcus lacustris]
MSWAMPFHTLGHLSRRAPLYCAAQLRDAQLKCCLRLWLAHSDLAALKSHKYSDLCTVNGVQGLSFELRANARDSSLQRRGTAMAEFGMGHGSASHGNLHSYREPTVEWYSQNSSAAYGAYTNYAGPSQYSFTPQAGAGPSFEDEPPLLEGEAGGAQGQQMTSCEAQGHSRQQGSGGQVTARAGRGMSLRQVGEQTVAAGGCRRQ